MEGSIENCHARQIAVGLSIERKPREDVQILRSELVPMPTHRAAWDILWHNSTCRPWLCSISPMPLRATTHTHICLACEPYYMAKIEIKRPKISLINSSRSLTSPFTYFFLVGPLTRLKYTMWKNTSSFSLCPQLFFFFLVSRNILSMASKGSLSGHAFPRLCLHMLRRLPESILVPESNFIQQDKTKTAPLQRHVHLFQRFKGQSFYMSSVQSVLKLDKNFHVGFLITSLKSLPNKVALVWQSFGPLRVWHVIDLIQLRWGHPPDQGLASELTFLFFFFFF